MEYRFSRIILNLHISKQITSRAIIIHALLSWTKWILVKKSTSEPGEQKKEMEQRTREYNEIILYDTSVLHTVPNACTVDMSDRRFIAPRPPPFTTMIIIPIQDRAELHKGPADRALKKIPRAIWIEDLSFFFFFTPCFCSRFPSPFFHRAPFSSIKTRESRLNQGRQIYIYIYVSYVWIWK